MPLLEMAVKAVKQDDGRWTATAKVSVDGEVKVKLKKPNFATQEDAFGFADRFAKNVDAELRERFDLKPVSGPLVNGGMPS